MDKIYGRKPVLDTLDTEIAVNKCYIQQSTSPLIAKIIDKCEKKNIEINFVDKNFFDKINMNHQGVMIEVESFKYKNLEDIENLERVIILDKIEDPHNLGAIIRSAESFDISAVIIPERRAAQVNPTVYKTSAGAINNMDIVRVVNISRCIEKLKEMGFWVYGLDGEGEDSLRNTNLEGKVALVVGNEGSGISKLVAKNCDKLVKIPMYGKINSLNASVAAAIAMYELVR